MSVAEWMSCSGRSTSHQHLGASKVHQVKVVGIAVGYDFVIHLSLRVNSMLFSTASSVVACKVMSVHLKLINVKILKFW